MSRRRNLTAKLPIQYQDASARIDCTLQLVGQLCSAAGTDEECDAKLIQDLGTIIKDYLRQRNALESIFGRCAQYDDDDFEAIVKEFRRRLQL